MIRKTLLALACLAACLVGAGFVGELHRASDSIAILRPVCAIACALGLCVARNRGLRLALAGVALLGLVTTGVHGLAQKPGHDLRLYTKNLGYHTTQMSDLVADIAAAKVDVVMLQEVTARNAPLLEALQPAFAHQHVCRFSGRIGIALASRHPFDGAPLCSESRALLAVPIRRAGQRLWAVSVHIPWPWPYDTAANEQAATRVLAGLDGPVVMAGDFNMLPWSGRVQRIADLTETRLAGPMRATLHVKSIPLPIDLVLAPGGGRIDTRPLFGSDHRGVVADVSVWGAP